MQSANQEVKYSFQVENSSAIKKLGDFQTALNKITSDTKQALAPLEYLGNLIKNVAASGDFSMSEKSMKKLYDGINRVIDPAHQLLGTFKELSRESSKFGKQAKDAIGSGNYTFRSDYADQMIAANEKRAKDFSAQLKAQLQQQADDEVRTAKEKAANIAQIEQQLQADKARMYREEAAEYGRQARVRLDAERKVAEERLRTAKKIQNLDTASLKGEVHVDPSRINLSEMFKPHEIDANFQKSMTSMREQMDKTGKSANKLSSAMKKVSAVTHSFARIAGIASGVALGATLADITKKGIAYYETLNLFNVAMHESVTQGREFISTMSEMYGLDPKALMDYTGMFYEMAYAVDVPAEHAYKMSTTLTRMTTDIASLFNVSIEQAANNLMSGMRGMSRAVLRYGMDLRATTVEAYANAHGIKQQFETMNEASREILRLVVAMDQASDAETDFARTIESPANQLRILKEQCAQLGRAISRFIIAPLQTALPVVIGFVAALRMLIDALASIFGLEYQEGLVRASESAKGVSDNVTGIGNAAKKAGKKMKDLVAPFDELNILSQNSGANAGAGAGAGMDMGIDPAVLQLLDDADWKMENIRLKAWDIRDTILEFLGFTLVPSALGEHWVFHLDTFLENIRPIIGLMGAFATVLTIVELPFGNLLGLFVSLGGILTSGIFDFLMDGAATMAHFGGVLGTGNTRLSTFLGSLGKLVALISGPLTLVLTALSILGTAIFVGGFFDWLTSSENFEYYMETWGGALHSIFQSLKDIFLAIVQAIVKAIHWCGEHFGFLYEGIASVISGILTILSGLLDFIAGVFTGDWDRAVDGLGQIWTGFTDIIYGALISVLNLGIKAINWFMDKVINGIIGTLNDIIEGITDILELIGLDISIRIPEVPEIALIPAHRPEHKFATGGVVTGPTRALIGEAGRSEAVLPLDNSPQMENLINRIADAVRGNNDVHVYIGGKEWDAFTYESAERGKQMVGYRPIMEGMA